MTDRYAMDPMEQDDDAPFPGGSTEQRDTWLGERATQQMETRAREIAADAVARGRSAAHRADFWMAYQTAAVKHNAPDADLIAWAVPLTEGRVFASRDIFAGFLTKERRTLLGRPLLDSERAAVWRVSAELWAALRTAGAAA